jgi:putative ABC transport system permease protein
MHDVEVGKLSGGEKQRVAILRAIINDPAIVLADEPTGALDRENAIKTLEMLKAISKERLVIVVSHNLDLALAYATRHIEVKDGQIVSDVSFPEQS